MRLLIDGYNLLHATDLFGQGSLEGTLRGSREALLDFLIARLPEKLRKQTLIVFDAQDAPPGLPNRYQQEGLDIWFARGYADADALLEEILSNAKGTRQLTVVSGDRRVQRAARSCGARPVDSTEWFSELRSQAPEISEAKPIESIGGTDQWVREFSDPEALRAIERESESAPPPKPLPPKPQEADPSKAQQSESKKKKRHREPPRADKGEFGEGVFDPFPPGYGEDLLNEPSSGEE